MADYARNRTFFASSIAPMLIVAGWMAFSLIWHEPVPPAWRVPLTLLLLLFSQSITAMRVLVTKKPDLPLRFLRVGGFTASSFMALSWLVLMRDTILALLFGLSFVLPGMEPRLFTPLLSAPAELLMLASSFALAGAGMASALRVPEVKEVRVPLRGLPPELEGLRIVHLSDLHIGSTFDGAWLEQVTARANALEPDFILITGDLADGSPDRIARHLRPLTRLKARYGVLISPGNHDYYSGLLPWMETWRSWGLPVLLNEHRCFEVRGRTVTVAGVTDPCAVLFRSHAPAMMPPDSRLALQGAPQGLRILMAHRPGEAEQNAALGVHLQLSGHTHGGQFVFLFPAVSRMNRGFRSGLYRVGSMMLYVSPGTGMWGYVPMRLGTSAELTLLTLTQG